MKSATQLRLLLIVAHPDDAEIRCGGLMSIYRKAGHLVKWISVTNGNAGHHLKRGPELAAIRLGEAKNATAVIGAECEVWDTDDGCLEPTLDLRWKVIKAIREFEPDLVLTHRSCDYHPDHRAVAQLVQDASFSVTVPALAPEVPALKRDPVIAYMADLFTRPNRLRADIALRVDPFSDAIVEMFSCHASQAFEWLPHVMGLEEPVPDDDAGREKWMREQFLPLHFGKVAERFRGDLVSTYGEALAARTAMAEVYEISEYARQLDEPLRERLFGFAIRETTP